MTTCTTCAHHRVVWTFQNGRVHYCLHPRSALTADGLPISIYRAREQGQSCGPRGDLHSNGHATFSARLNG